MGKSTAAAAFRRAGIPVFDADAAVHRLQARGGRAVRAIGLAFPGTVRDGAVDRALLRRAVVTDAAAMRRLEAILHPMVRAQQRGFVAAARRAGRRAVVLDIPLLFETGGEGGGGPGAGGQRAAGCPARPGPRATPHDGRANLGYRCAANARLRKAPPG